MKKQLKDVFNRLTMSSLSMIEEHGDRGFVFFHSVFSVDDLNLMLGGDGDESPMWLDLNQEIDCDRAGLEKNEVRCKDSEGRNVILFLWGFSPVNVN